MDFTIYDTTTGMIWSYGSCGSQEAALAQAKPAGHAVLTGTAFPDTQYYIVGGVGIPRPSFGLDPAYTIQADGFDLLTLTFPVVATVAHAGAVYPDCSNIEFTTDTPGAYVFDVDPQAPYKPFTVTINAV